MKLIKLVHIQLLLTICSWPILAFWGLPISLVSIPANIIFTPFLMLFLLLSVLIFFSELLSVPHQPLIWLLDTLTFLWTSILNWGSTHWLLAVPACSLLVLVPFIALSIMHYRLRPMLSLFALSTLFVGSFFLIHTLYTLPAGTHIIEECKLIKTPHLTCLVEQEQFCKKSPSWITFTLTPALRKKGISFIEAVIIQRPSITCFKCLTALMQCFPLDTIYLPPFEFRLNRGAWASWEKCLAAAQETGTKVEIIHETTLKNHLHLELENTYRKKTGISFKKVTVTVRI